MDVNYRGVIALCMKTNFSTWLDTLWKEYLWEKKIVALCRKWLFNRCYSNKHVTFTKNNLISTSFASPPPWNFLLPSMGGMDIFWNYTMLSVSNSTLRDTKSFCFVFHLFNVMFSKNIILLLSFSAKLPCLMLIL